MITTQIGCCLTAGHGDLKCICEAERQASPASSSALSLTGMADEARQDVCRHALERDAALGEWQSDLGAGEDASAHIHNSTARESSLLADEAQVGRQDHRDLSMSSATAHAVAH
jgi:hypothetical protein